MSLSLYDSSVKVYIRQLNNLSAILKKAEQWCDENNKPHSEIIEARLTPDMYALPFQIRACTKAARNGTLLTKGWAFTSHPAEPADETFAGLQARIEKTVGWLKCVKPEDIEGGEERPLSMYASGEEGKGPLFKYDNGQVFLTQVIFPEFWFHVAMAYAICRMKGVPVGKKDWILGGGMLDGVTIEGTLPL